jgi:hypothetical protein
LALSSVTKPERIPRFLPVGWALLAMVLPLVVMSAYIYESRINSKFSAAEDIAAMGIAVAAGLVCFLGFARRLTSSVGSLPRQIVLAGLYVAVAATVAFFWSFSFVCVVFQECL